MGRGLVRTNLRTGPSVEITDQSLRLGEGNPAGDEPHLGGRRNGPRTPHDKKRGRGILTFWPLDWNKTFQPANQWRWIPASQETNRRSPRKRMSLSSPGRGWGCLAAPPLDLALLQLVVGPGAPAAAADTVGLCRRPVAGFLDRAPKLPILGNIAGLGISPRKALPWGRLAAAPSWVLVPGEFLCPGSPRAPLAWSVPRWLWRGAPALASGPRGARRQVCLPPFKRLLPKAAHPQPSQLIS